MTRICAHCGTEVDGEALFCPTCGQPVDAVVEPELPPAPDWPEAPSQSPASDAGPPAGGAPSEDEELHEAPGAPAQPEMAPAQPEMPVPAGRAGEPEDAEPTSDAEGADDVPAPPAPPATTSHAWEAQPDDRSVPPWRRGAVHRATEEQAAASEAGDATGSTPSGAGQPAPSPSPRPGPAGRSGSRAPSEIVRVPQLLSDWLAGIGAIAGLLTMFLPWRLGGGYSSVWGLASGVNVLVTLVLIGVLVIVFLPDLLGSIPRRGLVLLVVGAVGTGIGLDRVGLPLTGAGGIVFCIAMLVLATGGAVAVLGYDRTVGGPQP